MGKKHDYRPALKAIQARALIILGEGDVLPEHGSRIYADCLPHVRLQIMKNSRTRGGHFPFSEQPEESAKIVADFLAEK